MHSFQSESRISAVLVQAKGLPQASSPVPILQSLFRSGHRMQEVECMSAIWHVNYPTSKKSGRSLARHGKIIFRDFPLNRGWQQERHPDIKAQSNI